MSSAAPGVDVEAVLSTLTLEEKAALTCGRDLWNLPGAPRLGVPPIRLADGPHGVRRPRSDDRPAPGDALPATSFPTGSALASTWDPELVREVGVALGEQARGRGVSVLLGPGANLKRTPLCGRSFEYFSEDPLLSAALATGWVRGLQSTGVAACVKHYALNNQERRRYTVDVVADDRALRELYLAAWEQVVVDARPWALMAAYNKVGGQHCTQNAELLTSVLREEWGFDGLVVSDWGAVTDRPGALAAGLDLEMPGRAGAGDAEVVAAVRAGRLAAEAVDRAAAGVLTLVGRTAPARAPHPPEDLDAHHELARRIAVAGTVLLRNEGAVLPLPAGAGLAVLGALASEPRVQGGGSSMVTPHRVDDVLSALGARSTGSLAFAVGYRGDGEQVDDGLLREAVGAAEASSVAVVCVGLPATAETEGRDRTHLRLPPAHDALVTALAAGHPRVVVVVSSGAPVEMPWVDSVAAVLQTHLAGEAAGAALADVLLGLEEPAGRLAETYPRDLGSAGPAARTAGSRQVEYRESVYVGYRYHDALGGDVLFPFGHGLGYTSFAFEDLVLSAQELDAGGELVLEVAVTLHNTGGRAGTEVVQVYVQPPGSVPGRPVQELRGLAKVRVDAGSRERVQVVLGRRAFARWSVEAGAWVVDPGRYQVRVGASSRDLRAWAEVEVVGPPPPADAHPPDPLALDAASFAALLRRPLPADAPPLRAELDDDTPLEDLRVSPAGRLLHALLRRGAARAAGAGTAEAALLADMAGDLPLRLLPMVSGGAVSPGAVQGLLALVHGRYLTGTGLVLRAVRERRAARR